jgi:hypothetical protein
MLRLLSCGLVDAVATTQLWVLGRARNHYESMVESNMLRRYSSARRRTFLETVAVLHRMARWAA